MSRALARHLASQGIRDARVLRALEEVPRRLFLPERLQDQAEVDAPLPIGHGQTISQPFVTALMTEALRLEGHERVLEIGTGSGYQTALLARLAAEVWSVEIVPELSARAAAVLEGTLRLDNVHLRVGDGRGGWPEAAPFQAIVVTAAPAEVPPALLAQLAPKGRLVIPVGDDPEAQLLKLLERGDDGVDQARDLLAVRFVPLVGDG